jgi:hypothetical protein
MAVGSPVSFSGVRSEFGTGSTALSAYVRGGGYVANHENNGSISSSSSGLALSQYLNTDKDFDSLYGGNSGLWTSGFDSYYDGFSYTEVISGYANLNASGSVGLTVVGGVGGTNSFNYVGVSPSSLFTATIVGAFDWNTGTDPFFTTADNFSFVLDGNWTSFTWSTVIVGGNGFSRTSASVPAGSFNGFYNTTTWTWFNSFTYSASSNFQIELVL